VSGYPVVPLREGDETWIAETKELLAEVKNLIDEVSRLVPISNAQPNEVQCFLDRVEALRNRMHDRFRARLRDAEFDFSRKSIDGTNKLLRERRLWIELLRLLPELVRLLDPARPGLDAEPPEVAKVVAEFKRPRGRMRDTKVQYGKFDPNREAASIAAEYVAKLRGGRERAGPHKVQARDGRKLNVHDLAVERAVEAVNAGNLHGAEPADPKVVKELLRRGRVKLNRFDW
jgi:hypothetical protein